MKNKKPIVTKIINKRNKTKNYNKKRKKYKINNKKF